MKEAGIVIQNEHSFSLNYTQRDEAILERVLPIGKYLKIDQFINVQLYQFKTQIILTLIL